jgi:hypothetical protein
MREMADRKRSRVALTIVLGIVAFALVFFLPANLWMGNDGGADPSGAELGDYSSNFALKYNLTADADCLPGDLRVPYQEQVYWNDRFFWDVVSDEVNYTQWIDFDHDCNLTSLLFEVRPTSVGPPPHEIFFIFCDEDDSILSMRKYAEWDVPPLGGVKDALLGPVEVEAGTGYYVNITSTADDAAGHYWQIVKTKGWTEHRCDKYDHGSASTIQELHMSIFAENYTDYVVECDCEFSSAAILNMYYNTTTPYHAVSSVTLGIAYECAVPDYLAYIQFDGETDALANETYTYNVTGAEEFTLWVFFFLNATGPETILLTIDLSLHYAAVRESFDVPGIPVIWVILPVIVGSAWLARRIQQHQGGSP